MYEVMASYWPSGEDDPSATDAMRKPMPKIVFSTSLEHVEHNARLVRGDVGKVLKGLRQEFDGDLDVGGPNLAGQFVRRGLVDEYRLVIHPVVLGAGTPFGPRSTPRCGWVSSIRAPSPPAPAQVIRAVVVPRW